MDRVMVSVICTTYNHGKYIAQALDSMLMQQTNFDYEIIVHDDCSTDGTREIVEHYQSMYPKKIKAICELENQYSQGVDVMQLCVSKTSGKYLAMCEGDDWWLDDRKLQLQVDAMETHPESDLCVCRAVAYDPTGTIELNEIRPKDHDAILTTEEIITNGGDWVATASSMYRREIYETITEYEKVIAFDYTHEIKGSLRGGIIYLDREMAAYRTSVRGSWTEHFKHDKQFRRQQFQKEIDMLREVDKATNGIYHEVIEKRIVVYCEPIDKLRERREQVLEMLQHLKGNIYIWGLGSRGNACQEFCREEGIAIAGVCDTKDVAIGTVTEEGYQIYSAEHVLQDASSILATNTYIYRFLQERNYNGYTVDMQQYMP